MSTTTKIHKQSLRKIDNSSTMHSAEQVKDGYLADDVERQKRLQAIDLIFGMWKERDDVPKDGLAFQQEIRAEW